MIIYVIFLRMLKPMFLGGRFMDRTVTSRISELLKERGYTQKQLAERAELTESAVSHYVKGNRVPRGVNLIKIARALGTTTDDLLGEGRMDNKGEEMQLIKTLIARNASKMTNDEKMEVLSILSKND